VPTIAEAALPGFTAAPWWGIVGPAGMPRATVARLSAALKRATETPAVVQQLSDNGCRAFPLEPAPFEAFVRTGNLKWSRVIEAAGLKVS
jgi:tripartite-type tricarboxylate transporter receptor subunit TctC